MSKTIIPSQLGYTAPGSSLRSQIYLGKNVSVNFEAVGLGDNGRPDELEALKIHISQDGVAQGAIYLDVSDILELKQNNPSLSGEIFLKLRTAAVCVENSETGDSEEKKVVLICSEPF